MLVELTRSVTREDHEGLPRVLPILINTNQIAAIFEGERPNEVIIRLAQGRGFSVQGTYAEVVRMVQDWANAGHTAN